MILFLLLVSVSLKKKIVLYFFDCMICGKFAHFLSSTARHWSVPRNHGCWVQRVNVGIQRRYANIQLGSKPMSNNSKACSRGQNKTFFVQAIVYGKKNHRWFPLQPHKSITNYVKFSWATVLTRRSSGNITYLMKAFLGTVALAKQ